MSKNPFILELFRKYFNQTIRGLTKQFAYCFPDVMLGMITLELPSDGFGGLRQSHKSPHVIYPSGHWILKSRNSNAENTNFFLFNKLFLMFSTKWTV